MNQYITSFVFTNFFVAFFSDIALNLFGFIPSLRSYFQDKTVIESAIYAGLTVFFALLITMTLAKIFFGFTVPTTNSTLVNYCILAFALGYLIDIFINRFHVFGHSLDLYYTTLGEGFWGAVAFVFSILVSYFFMKIVDV